jgi:hypothetical protein
MKFKEIASKHSLYYFFFFILTTLYYLFKYKPSVYYHFHQPIFLFDKTFFREFLSYPGGLTEWAGQFFFQFLYSDITGALLLALIAVTIFIVIHKALIKMFALPTGLLSALMPVIFLLILQNDYHYPLIISLRYLLSVALFLLYINMNRQVRLVLILSSCLFYYLLGGWTYIFWILVCILFELISIRKTGHLVYVGILLLSGIGIPLLAARFVFSITISEAYRYLNPAIFFYPPFNFAFSSSLYLMFLMLPILMICLFVYQKFIREKVFQHLSRSFQLPLRLNPVFTQAVLVVLISGGVLMSTFNEIEQKKIKVDRLADQGRWGELLRLVPEITQYDRMVNFQVNRALYFTGQLLDNLFTCVQVAGTDGLFVSKIITSQICMQASDLYFDLGHINAAQVMAYEAQMKFKYNPRVLQRLAMTNLINGQYQVSGMYLDLLAKSLVYRKWAQHYQKYLSNDVLLAGDKTLRIKRQLYPNDDFFIVKERPYHDLILLLRSNPNNRMAYEYLMAYFMLDGNLKSLIKYINYSQRFNYTRIPRHLEEAILIAENMMPGSINLSKYSISQRTIDNYAKFNAILENVGNPKIAQEQLIKENLSNTYWYYLRYINPRRSDQDLRAEKSIEREY